MIIEIIMLLLQTIGETIIGIAKKIVSLIPAFYDLYKIISSVSPTNLAAMALGVPPILITAIVFLVKQIKKAIA